MINRPVYTSIASPLPHPDYKRYEHELYNVLYSIDEKVYTARKKAIMLVGLSRAGKSTTYNWILGRKLVAKYENSSLNQ